MVTALTHIVLTSLATFYWINSLLLKLAQHKQAQNILSIVMLLYCGLYYDDNVRLKVELRRYFTLIIFREIAQRVHANPSNDNFRPHGKH